MNQAVQKVNDAELVGAQGLEIVSLRKPFVANVVFSNDYAELDGHFNSTQMYSYFYDLEDDVKIGDKLVVKTPSDELVVVTVADLEQSNVMARKFIVDKVDTQAYEERALRAEKKKQLRALLDVKVKQLDEEAKLEAYAAKDDDFKALFEEYKTL